MVHDVDESGDDDDYDDGGDGACEVLAIVDGDADAHYDADDGVQGAHIARLRIRECLACKSVYSARQ